MTLLWSHISVLFTLVRSNKTRHGPLRTPQAGEEQQRKARISQEKHAGARPRWRQASIQKILPYRARFVSLRAACVPPADFERHDGATAWTPWTATSSSGAWKKGVTHACLSYGHHHELSSPYLLPDDMAQVKWGPTDREGREVLVSDSIRQVGKSPGGVDTCGRQADGGREVSTHTRKAESTRGCSTHPKTDSQSASFSHQPRTCWHSRHRSSRSMC